MPVMKYIPGLNTRLNGSSVSTGFTYGKTREIKYDQINEWSHWQAFQYNYGLTPLLKLSLDFKNKLRFDNDVTWSLDRKVDEQPGSSNPGTETYALSEKATASYAIDKQRTLKLLFWDLTLNNQLNLTASYTYTLNWSYQWTVNLPNGKQAETYDDYLNLTSLPLQTKDKTKVYDAKAGASYDITTKLKAGADFGWKKNLTVNPGKADSDASNKIQYDILMQMWVSFTF
jgi:hypothetical protein